MHISLRSLLTVLVLVAPLSLAARAADEPAKPETKPAAEPITLGDAFVVTPPANWKKVKPQNRIIDFEFKVPAAKGDENDGRVTVMGAGGTIELNIDRWIGQFEQPDGGSTKEKAKIEKMKVGDQDVQVVDISGTYKDTVGGPFSGGKTTMRENYRMLSAIVSGKKQGNYFIKFYGPDKTVEANHDAFMTMVKSIKKK